VRHLRRIIRYGLVSLCVQSGAWACGGSLSEGDHDGGRGSLDAPSGAEASRTGVSDGSCLPRATRCVGPSVETCGADGQWGSGVACTDQACAGGVCTGVCTPNATRCSGNAIETCGSSGEWGTPWGTPWPCATGTCGSGACTGATTAAESCAIGGSGLTDCGASHESCCTSLEVPGGAYFRTYDRVRGVSGATLAPDGGPTAEADPANVSGFGLDKYLVTVGRFRQFVSA